MILFILDGMVMESISFIKDSETGYINPKTFLFFEALLKIVL